MSNDELVKELQEVALEHVRILATSRFRSHEYEFMPSAMSSFYIRS